MFMLCAAMACLAYKLRQVYCQFLVNVIVKHYCRQLPMLFCIYCYFPVIADESIHRDETFIALFATRFIFGYNADCV